MIVGKIWQGVSWRITIACVVTALTSFGCGGGQPPQGPSAAKSAASKTPGTAAQTTALEKTAESSAVPSPLPYVYNPEGRRDPFRSILVTSDLGKSLESLPVLLRTEVGELRLIGIVWGGFGYSAMVQTPDGKGYTIRVGTPVGPNRGKVQKITERYLTVEERYTDIFGENKVREVKLDLHPQKEGSE
jgi:Tfp pilus assembly protein PilP